MCCHIMYNLVMDILVFMLNFINISGNGRRKTKTGGDGCNGHVDYYITIR